MTTLIAPLPQEMMMVPISQPAGCENISRSVVLPANLTFQTSPAVVTPRDEKSVVTTASSPPLHHHGLPAPAILATKLVAPNKTSSDSGNSDASRTSRAQASGMRLNKFVRRLHDMLQSEQNSGIVEWRRGLLVLHSTDTFAKSILPKYFNTRNFKTFRRQLNYYGFVHVRSFSTTGSTTTALWVNRGLAKTGSTNIASVLQLKRVEPCDAHKTAEGRRVRKELAVSTVEDDIGVSAKSLQMEQIRSMALRADDIPLVVHCHPLLPNIPEAEPEPDNECAANLLLMLSKSTTR